MSVIIKPLMTEKATQLAVSNVYVFEIQKNATKPQVSAALEKMFKVKVASVAVTIRKGKVKTVGRQRKAKQQPNRKIAYITLSEGKIDILPKT